MYRTIFIVIAALAFKGEAEVVTHDVSEGEQLELICNLNKFAQGCLWSRNGVSMFSDANNIISNEDGVCKLRILKVSRNVDVGVFVCSTSNDPVDQQEHRVIAIVKPNDVFLEDSDGARITAPRINLGSNKSDIELRCIVDGGLPNATIIWRENGNEVSPSSVNSEPTTDNLFKLISTLKVTFGPSAVPSYSISLNEKYEKNITCEVKHPAYENMFAVVVGIQYPTTIAELKRKDENDVIQLICQADGNPDATIIFRMVENESWDPASSVNGNVLTVEESGNYYCLAKNDLSEEYKKSNVVEIDRKGTSPVRPEQANVGVAIGASLGGIFLLVIIVAVSVFLYRREKLCFSKHSSRPTHPDDAEGNAAQIIEPDKTYENQDVKTEDEKVDNEKQEKNEKAELTNNHQ